MGFRVQCLLELVSLAEDFTSIVITCTGQQRYTNTHELKAQAHCICLKTKLAKHGVTPPESRTDDRGIAASHHGLGQAGKSNQSTDAQLRIADTARTLGSMVLLSVGGHL